jgi:hypothetical protein
MPFVEEAIRQEAGVTANTKLVESRCREQGTADAKLAVSPEARAGREQRKPYTSGIMSTFVVAARHALPLLQTAFPTS